MTSTAPLPSLVAHCEGVRRGEGRESRKSDARAQGTNPRFPWKPSATMLTYSLKAPRSFRGRPRRTPKMIPPHLTRPQQVTTAESSRTTVRPPGAGLLTWHWLVAGRGDPAVEGDRERV